MKNAREFADKFLSPLSEETAKLFEPIRLSETDRLIVRLNDKGTFFTTKAFGRKVRYVPFDFEKHDVCYSQPDGLVYAKEEHEYSASFEAASKWQSRIPERRRLDGFGGWEFMATDFTALIISHVWPREQIEFSTEAEELFDYLLLRLIDQANSATITADYKLNGNVPSFAFLDSRDNPLANYQRVGLRNSLKKEGYGLFMEQGTGKTPIVISRICNEAKNYKNRMMRCLVVCPKNVRTNWRVEFEKFATVPGKVVVLSGTQLDRIKLLVEATKSEDGCEWTCVVCSYDTVDKSWEAMSMVEWDLCVLDESHSIRTVTTKRCKRALQLRDRCTNRMCLTGTPIANSMMDLYSQFEFLGKGLSGFSSWKSFQKYYGRWEKRQHGNVLVGYKNMPLIQERLARLSFMITKKEALPNLPDKVYDVSDVSMSKEQAEIYIKVRDKLLVEIENDLNSAENKSLAIKNVLTKLLRLAQITSGYITWDAIIDCDGNIQRPQYVEELYPNPKLERLIEILKDKKPEDKTIVWACWVSNIKQIAARLEQEGIKNVTYYGKTSDKDRELAEKNFNSDFNTKVLIGNPAAGGSGLNLLGHIEGRGESNCNHLIYYSQNWSMVHRSQSEDRAHRRGTRTHVQITDLMVPNSIDEEIRQRVVSKRVSAYALQDVQKIMTALLNSNPLIGDE